MKKYENLETYQTNVVTYKSKTNAYGNRLNLIVNYATKKFSFYGCNHGDYGTVRKEMLQRDIKKIMNTLISEGYEKITTNLNEEFGYTHH